MCVCVYYCRTYYKAVRWGGGREWRTCAMRDDEPRPVWMSPLITHFSFLFFFFFFFSPAFSKFTQLPPLPPVKNTSPTSPLPFPPPPPRPPGGRGPSCAGVARSRDKASVLISYAWILLPPLLHFFPAHPPDTPTPSPSPPQAIGGAFSGLEEVFSGLPSPSTALPPSLALESFCATKTERLS